MKNNKPLISVIVPIYNVEKYLEECIESIIGQTVGFENLEILLINDFGNDKSEEIASRYVEKYPKNVRLVKHSRNRGISAARNTGIKEATGECIAFLDSDDYLDKNAFKVTLGQMKEDSSDLCIFGYKYFSESGRDYQLNPSGELFRGENYSIPFHEMAQYPELFYSLSVCNKLHKKSLIDQLSAFPEGKNSHEDNTFSIESYINSNRISIVSDTLYYYRKREDSLNQSSTDIAFKSISYTNNLADQHLSLHSLVKDLPQFKLASQWYAMRSWYAPSHLLLINELSYEFDRAAKNNLYEKTKEIFEECNPGDSYTGIGSDHERLILSYLGSKNLTHAKFIYWRKVFFNKVANLIPKKRIGLQKSKKLAENLKDLIEISFFRLISVRPKKEIWLFADRPDEAQDNAFALFEYACKQDDGIEKYFIISKTAPQKEIEKIERVGKVLLRNSVSHKKMFIKSTKLISSHMRGAVEPWAVQRMNRYYKEGYYQKRYIFLQHGVTKDDISDLVGKNAEAGNFDLFITSTEEEYDFILENFGYSEKEVVLTGMPRIDKLKKDNKPNAKDILIIPSWRTWLKYNPSKHSSAKFLKSNFYKHYQGLINNPELIKHLEANKINATLYLHKEFQVYKHYFYTSSDRINLNPYGKSIPELMQNSGVMITDYSSVFFDFSFLGKPVIFYHFDFDDYRKIHYKKGYFDYKKFKKSPLFLSEYDVITNICGIDEHQDNCKIDNESISKKVYDLVSEIYEQEI